MNLPKLSVTRPITTVMILVSVLVVGGIALARLPLAYLPELDVPYIGIRIPYPNSNPTQVEKEITKPVEEVLATLAGVKTMRSESSADEATFDMEFNWGQNLDIVRMQVSEKMDQIRPTLPGNVGEIMIFSFNTSDIPVVQGRISAKGVDLSENYDLLESRVLNRLRRVPGVARVDLDGVAPKEIDISLVLSKIKEHNVDVGELIRRLQGTSSNMVLGQVDKGGLRYTARVVSSFESVDAIGEFPVNAQGLRLNDVAEISYEEPPIRWGRHLDQEKAIALEVFKESTANTVEVVRAVHQVITDDISNDPLLQGVELFVWEDQAEEITGGINGLLKAGAIGAFLAIFSLYFFLRRLDSTVIVALSIPFSVIAACGVMYFMGMTLNILSMMGLMVGVGMLVDNAIVVLESIDRRHRNEKDTKIAALQGSKQVVMAVTASTATTLIVFLPLVVGADTGLTTWLREVGVTMSLALACSLFSSLTLIPLVSAHFLRARQSEPSRLVSRMEDWYAATLAWTLRHKITTAIAVLVIIGVGLSPLFTGMVEQSMFSAQVNERLYLSYDFDDFHYKSEAERAVNVIEKYLYENQEDFLVKSVYSFYQENFAGTTIVLTRKDLDGEKIGELRAKIREGIPEIPGVRCYFHEDADSGGSDTFFAVKFFGQDSGVLQGLGEEMERRLETVEGVRDVSASHKRGRKEVQVSVNREKASRLGMTAKDVSDIFGFTLGGMRLNRFNTGEREVETWIALRLEDRQDLDDLKRIQFGTGDGGVITLGDVADFQIITRQQEIVREDRKVRSAVWATYEGEDWNSVREEIEGLAGSLDMPAGYSWSWNDRILEQDQQGAQMGINFLLALALVYLVMASLFESLAQPFAILLCSVIFALSGAAWMLVITDTPFNMMSWIGMLILIGIVVNNGIVLLDRMNQLRAEGFSREAAIIEAGRDRMRPILMTAATTVIGLIPLAMGGSTISGLFYYPLARTVIGGLLASAFLTLVALPNVTLAVEGIATWMRRVWSLSGPRRQPAATAGASGNAELVPTHPAP